MKGFLIKLPILSVIAVVVAEIFLRGGESFDIKVLLLRIPFALAGYLGGWVIRWILIHLMGATTSDWRDLLASIVLPFAGALFGAAAIAPAFFS
jgi:hypothetical protein